MNRRIARITLGRSIEHRTIEAFLWSPSGRCATILFAGFHGDEPKGVRLANRLLARLAEDERLRGRAGWLIVPVVNPDGFARRRRKNGRGVDVNRNFPTTDWAGGAARSRMYGGARAVSEPETRAVIRAVKTYRPARIITVHSISDYQHCNNYDGPGRRLAKRLAHGNGYPVAESIGYPTPGSFGTWAGIDRRIPTVTLELPAHHSPRRCVHDNEPVLLAILSGRTTK